MSLSGYILNLFLEFLPENNTSVVSYVVLVWSPSFGGSGGFIFLIVAFAGYPHLYFKIKSCKLSPEESICMNC